MVTIAVSGEGAGQFRAFIQQIAKICNSGASRTLGIMRPAAEDEREAQWDFDGDGSTKIEIRE